MTVVLLPESHAKEIANVTENDEDEVGDVGCEEVIVGWLVLDGFWELATLMSAGISMCLRVERSKLSMLSRLSSCLGR